MKRLKRDERKFWDVPPAEQFACVYCEARFRTLDELEAHREHCGPQEPNAA